MAKRKIAEFSTLREEKNAFYDRLSRLDWYFNFSDSAQVWRKGKQTYDSIKAEAYSVPWKTTMFNRFWKFAYLSKEKPKKEDFMS